MVRWSYPGDRQDLKQNTRAERDSSSEESGEGLARAMDCGPTNLLFVLVRKFEITSEQGFPLYTCILYEKLRTRVGLISADNV